MRFPTHRALRKQTQRAFTLVEMIGVLAIIAILASLLIPRVFQAIGDSKISNAATTCNSIKAAVNEYYGQYGLIAGPNGSPITNYVSGIYEDWDLKVLVSGGFAEKPFSVRIGNGSIGSASTPAGSRLRVVKIGSDSTLNPIAALSGNGTIDNGAYNLDGAGDPNDIKGALLVEAIIPEVDSQDAKALNDRLDGPNLGVVSGVGTVMDENNDPQAADADANGRVKYIVDPATGKATVHIYLAHR